MYWRGPILLVCSTSREIIKKLQNLWIHCFTTFQKTNLKEHTINVLEKNNYSCLCNSQGDTETPIKLLILSSILFWIIILLSFEGMDNQCILEEWFPLISDPAGWYSKAYKTVDSLYLYLLKHLFVCFEGMHNQSVGDDRFCLVTIRTVKEILKGLLLLIPCSEQFLWFGFEWM